MKPSEKYRFCNHHHELSEKHVFVDYGDGPFVANVEAIPLLRELNAVGLKTRTHHYTGEKEGFVGILMDNVRVEIRRVHERDADRTMYNGKMELIISWG